MSCCDNENSLRVPKGDPGDPGAPGSDGSDGVNAYTVSTSEYLQPAVDTTVAIAASNASWVDVGQLIFVENGGYYQVVGSSSSSITVAYSSEYSAFNQALSGVGDTINSGAKISPGGLKGAAGTLPYLIYSALISQSGTSGPTAIVLQNTIGSIAWNYGGTGVFQGLLAGAFPTDKTWGVLQTSTGNGNYSTQLDVKSNNPDFIIIRTQDTGAYANGLLDKYPIEIRVYP